MKHYKCIQIIGPYKGQFHDNIITFILFDGKNRLAWHSGPNKHFDFKIGENYTGIFATKRNNINYKESNPSLLLTQLELL